MDFIDLATRPLADKEEAREQARAELIGRLTHASPSPKDDSLETATARIKGKLPLSLRKAMGLSILALVVVVSLVAAIYLVAYGELIRLTALHRIDFVRHRSPTKFVDERISPDQRLFFYANSYFGHGRPEVKRWLEDSTADLPGDPAWFEEFARQSVKMGNKFPDAYREHGKRIDPDNGTWALMGANHLASLLSEMKTPSGGWHTSPHFLQFVALSEEAGQGSRFESYIPERNLKRFQMLGSPSDLAERADQTALVLSQRRPNLLDARFEQSFLSQVEELARKKDAEGLKKWIALGEKLSMESLRNPDAGPGGWTPLFSKDHWVGSVKRYTDGLGLTTESDRLQKWMDEVRLLGAPLPFDLRLHAAASAAPRVRDHRVQGTQDLVTMEELEPGRRAEHALIDRYTAYLMAGVFAFLAFLVFIEAWRRSLPVRGLAQGLMPLLRANDYLWLIGLGVVLPVAWYVILMRFTPLGCRDFTIGLASHAPFYARGTALILLSLCMLIQTANWRLAKRGGFVGLRPGLLWPGWIVAIYVALYIPLVGLIRLAPNLKEIYLLCGLSALGVPILWLMWKLGALVFRPRHAALGSVMMCRMLFVAFLVGALVLLAMTPLLKMEERFWVAKDTIGGPARDGSSDTVLAARSEVLFRERLLKAME